MALVASTIGAFAPAPAAAVSVPEITLPIPVDHLDSVRWTDTWGAPRSGGRSHVGVDMLGPKMTPLVAAADGTITWMRHDSARGNILYLTDDQGWQYTYIHINNDTPGTDDGANRYDQAFGPGIERGARVQAGDVIAFMGDSGNAEWTASHLHFEIVSPDGQNVNPAPIVDAARDRALRTVPEVDPGLVAPFASFEVMADNLYQVVHGRSPSNGELATLASSVNDEGLDAALASVIGPNTAGASLDRLYEAYFLRQADTDGFNYWMNQFRAGASLAEIAEWFADSEEFQTRYAGLDFSVFLDQLYRDVLGREPDEAGKAYWMDLLNRGLLTRGTIVIQFTEGTELVNATRHRSEVT
ncbi:MAG: DUF4214 domain-containing protein, partial [Acidimicrobiales bacterium]